MLDKEWIQKQIDDIDRTIDYRKSFLKWAKKKDVRYSLYLDIYNLTMQREIYYNLLRGFIF